MKSWLKRSCSDWAWNNGNGYKGIGQGVPGYELDIIRIRHAASEATHIANLIHMKNQTSVLSLRGVVLIFGALMTISSNTQACVNPGSTSWFSQILIAGLTAVVYFFSSTKGNEPQLFGKSPHAHGRGDPTRPPKRCLS